MNKPTENAPYGQRPKQEKRVFTHVIPLENDACVDYGGDEIRTIYFFRKLKARDMAEGLDFSTNRHIQNAFVMGKLAHLPHESILDLDYADYMALDKQLMSFLG